MTVWIALKMLVIVVLYDSVLSVPIISQELSTSREMSVLLPPPPSMVPSNAPWTGTKLGPVPLVMVNVSSPVPPVNALKF